MKIKDGYMLKEVAGNKIVVPTAGVSDFKCMIVLNSSAAFLWNKLVEGAEQEELIEALLCEYNVDEETAKRDVSALIEKMKAADLLV